MDDFENKLKQLLEQESLKEPGITLDEQIKQLIAQSSANTKDKWFYQLPTWSVAASLLVVLALFTFKDKAKDPVQLAFEESFQLESQIRDAKSSISTPVSFIQANRLSREISEIDSQLQLLLAMNDQDEELLKLMQQRIEKLTQMKELYQIAPQIIRI